MPTITPAQIADAIANATDDVANIRGKIQAARHLRLTTGCTLREAADAIGIHMSRPKPLAVGDEVWIRATVYDLPDVEDEPGEGEYTFTVRTGHGDELVSIRSAQVSTTIRRH